MDHDVMIYGLKTCRYCRDTRTWFEEHHIPFRTVNIDSLKGDERKAMEAEVLEASGGRSYPVAVIDGQAIVGYHPDEFAARVDGGNEA